MIAVEQQVPKEHAREEVLEEMAFANANEQCRAAILLLSWEPPPSLHQMLKVCRMKVPLMGPPPGQRVKTAPPPVKFASAETAETPPASCTPAQRRRSFWGKPDQPCFFCSKTGHWLSQCPLKKDFDNYKNRGKVESGRSAGGKGVPQKRASYNSNYFLFS